MLGWFCEQLTTVEGILSGHIASTSDLHDDSLPDEIVDSDISIIKSFFDDETWLLVLEKGMKRFSTS